MEETIYQILVGTSVPAYLASLAAQAAGRGKISRLLSCTGLLLAGLAVAAGIIETMRLPLYGPFETAALMAVVVGVCIEINERRNENSGIAVPARLAVVLLLMFAWTRAGEFKFDYYIYGSLIVQLFFFLRITAAGVLLFAFLLYVRAFADLIRPATPNNPRISRKAANTLAAGALFFLGSELSGTAWCILGWGDIWHWSANFFESASLFLILMLPLHFPGNAGKKSPSHAFAGGLCALLAVLAITLPW